MSGEVIRSRYPETAQYFERNSYSNPVFVNENTLAYLDDTSGTKQLCMLDLGSGGRENITNYSEGLISLLASSSTTTIVYGLDEKGDERQQLHRLSLSSRDPQRLTSDDQAFYEPGVISDDGKAVIYRTNERDHSIFDICVTFLDDEASEVWLKNGGQVLAVDIHEDKALVVKSISNMDSDLLLLNRGGEAKNLTRHDGEQWLYGAALDRFGDGVWLLSSGAREFVSLMYLNLKTGEFHTHYKSEWDVELFSVAPNGEHIALSVNAGGYSNLHIISTARDNSGAINIDCSRGVIDGFSWSPDSRSVAFGISTAEAPSEILLGDLEGRARPLVSGSETIPPPTVTPKSVSFETWDGRQVPGFLYLPSGSGPFSALVEIHGGPEGQRRPEYGSTGASIQYLVSQGIAVLALNIRGSTGYGKEYCHLDDKEKRLDALKDVEKAAEWLGSRDDIDANKIAVFGISYGGFMTLSAISRLPHLWAAGAEMVGMAHLGTFLERTGAWRRPHRESEYGSLEYDKEMLDRVSPLPLVDQIACPLLVFHGRNDARVPLFESEQIAEAVAKRGLDVELTIYDDEGHVFNKRKNLIDAYGRIGEFLKRHLSA